MIMTQEEYINKHPEQFKDGIDKWLFLEFGILGGCCSAEKSHEYHIARMVVEKMIDKACEWLSINAMNSYDETTGDFYDKELVENFHKAMEE